MSFSTNIAEMTLYNEATTPSISAAVSELGFDPSEDTEWMDQGACVLRLEEPGVTLSGSDEIFFPYQGRGSNRAAKKICGECVVRPECLVYGLETSKGVFGGTSPDERDNIRRNYPRITKTLGEVIVKIDLGHYKARRKS